MCETCGNEMPNLRAIWEEGSKRDKEWRDAGEIELLRRMNDAYNGLKACGWKEAIYAPKDGTRFISISAGSTGVFPCYWMDNKLNGGGFWAEAHGDLWPAKPVLWKPMPSNSAISGKYETSTRTA